jgi:hypothetical protein
VETGATTDDMWKIVGMALDMQSAISKIKVTSNADLEVSRHSAAGKHPGDASSFLPVYVVLPSTSAAGQARLLNCCSDTLRIVGCRLRHVEFAPLQNLRHVEFAPCRICSPAVLLTIELPGLHPRHQNRRTLRVVLGRCCGAKDAKVPPLRLKYRSCAGILTHKQTLAPRLVGHP